MIGIILGIVVLDRISKILAVRYLQEASLPLWKNVFHLTYIENTGAAFSLFEGHSLALGIFSFIMVALLGFFLFKRKKEGAGLLEQIALAFIIGGAAGNLYDRLVLGYVVDYFDFRLINFAVFNVADSFITIGAGLILLSFFLEEKNKNQEKGL